MLYISGDSYLIDKISWTPIEGPLDKDSLEWIVKGIESYLSGYSRTFPGYLSFIKGRPVWTRKRLEHSAEGISQQILILISSIPYSHTMTYGEIAFKLNNVRLARVVGQVCKNNPLPILVPCHRVIGKNSIGGYTGGIAKKHFLLDLESGATHMELRQSIVVSPQSFETNQ
ncbi:MAG: MGMT family protein [Deltaproteobacteria bacterium]|nr:MGMT family protein [Deltaproteobacteria bacterium]